MASTLPVPFGTLLKRARRAARLTQEELAARAGYSAAYISLLERNVRLPTPATIAVLAEALDLSPAERASFHAALVRPASSPPARLRQVSTTPSMPPLVGRAHEMLLLDQHLVGAGPPLLLLAGEPGIGKTRLLQETAQRAAETGWTVLEGGCHRSSGQEPYAPLLLAVAEHLRRQSPAQQRVALEGCTWLVRLLPELAEQAVVPLPRWTLPPEQERRLMFAAVGRYLANSAGPAGTFLVLDDLQWADADALDLLAVLVRAAHEAPLSVVGAYRSTEVRPNHPLARLRADLRNAGLATSRELGQLSALESAALWNVLVEGLAEAADPQLQQQVLKRAEGVPYFLVSYARGLRASALQGQEASDLLGRAPAVRSLVPVDIADGIQQQVAALPPAARDLLGLAAVIGRLIPLPLLSSVAAQLGQSEPELLSALEALAQAGLLVETGAEALAFNHDLVREVVDASLGAARRATLHRWVAEALEQQALSSRHAVPLEDLAAHYFAAAVWPKALDYGQRAGEQALRLFAPRTALDHLTRAVQAAAHLSDPPPAALYRARGQAHELLGSFEQAQTDYERALERAHETQDGQLAWQSTLDLGFLWAGRDFERAGSWFEQAMSLAEQLGDARLSAQSLGLGSWFMNPGHIARELQGHADALANWFINTGHLAKGLQGYADALAFFEAQQDRAGMAETLDLLGLLSSVAGDTVSAVRYFERALEQLRAEGSRKTLIFCLAMYGIIASPYAAEECFVLPRGFAACERAFREALQLARDIAWAEGEALVEMNYSIMLGAFGKLGAALEHGQQALQIATSIQHRRRAATTHAFLGRIYGYLLAPEQALRYTEPGQVLARQLGATWWLGWNVFGQAQAYLQQGQLAPAEATLQAIQSPTHQPQVWLERALLRLWAELALAQGHPDLALQRCEVLLQTAIPVAGTTEGLPIPMLFKCKGEALAALGRLEESAQILEEARQGAIGQQALPHLWQIERALGRTYQRLKQEEQAQRAFSAARATITQLGETIEEQALREQFLQRALGSLPPEGARARE